VPRHDKQECLLFDYSQYWRQLSVIVLIACHAELREATDYSIEEMVVCNNVAGTMLNKVVNVAVSDTTEVDSSN